MFLKKKHLHCFCHCAVLSLFAAIVYANPGNYTYDGDLDPYNLMEYVMNGNAVGNGTIVGMVLKEGSTATTPSQIAVSLANSGELVVGIAWKNENGVYEELFQPALGVYKTHKLLKTTPNYRTIKETMDYIWKVLFPG